MRLRAVLVSVALGSLHFGMSALHAVEPELKYFVDVAVPSLDAARDLAAAGFDIAGIDRGTMNVGLVVTPDALKKLEAMGWVGDDPIEQRRAPGDRRAIRLHRPAGAFGLHESGRGRPSGSSGENHLADTLFAGPAAVRAAHHEGRRSPQRAAGVHPGRSASRPRGHDPRDRAGPHRLPDVAVRHRRAGPAMGRQHQHLDRRERQSRRRHVRLHDRQLVAQEPSTPAAPSTTTGTTPWRGDPATARAPRAARRPLGELPQAQSRRLKD